MEPKDGAPQSLPTCGQANKECNQRHGLTLRRTADQLRSEMDFCRVRARLRCRFALALRMAMKEFDEEMRKQGVGWTTELEYWTAELAPLVMTKLKETLERHGFELKKDKCTACCPTPERVDCVREEMTQFLKWTPDGLMILGTDVGNRRSGQGCAKNAKAHGLFAGRKRNAEGR